VRACVCVYACMCERASRPVYLTPHRSTSVVSSVEVALLLYTYTYADRFPVSVTEELINVVMYIYPLTYQKREEKGKRKRDTGRTFLGPFQWWKVA